MQAGGTSCSMNQYQCAPQPHLHVGGMSKQYNQDAENVQAGWLLTSYAVLMLQHLRPHRARQALNRVQRPQEAEHHVLRHQER